MLSFLKISKAGAATAREQRESAAIAQDIIEAIIKASAVVDEIIIVDESRLLMQGILVSWQVVMVGG
jgi:hypothetical protein